MTNADNICPYKCAYRQNSGRCSYTGGYDGCQYRRILGYDYTTKEFLAEPVGSYDETYVSKPKTNADRIRQMSDEELAKLIEPVMDCAYCPAKSEECDRHYEDEEDGEMPPDCSYIILHWLRKEADG